jgi:hypothetical protein
MELEGTIDAGFIGLCHITGVKVRSQPQDPHVGPEAQWSKMEKKRMDMLVKQDGENEEPGHL